MAECRLISPVCDSAPEKGVLSKYRVVSHVLICPKKLSLHRDQLTHSPGSYYSFQNPHVREARLFFTQGCIPSEAESSGNAESPNGAPESEFEAENEPTTAKATKAKGRPKGKGKAKAK